MSQAWQTVVFVGVGAMFFKAVGPVAIGGRVPSARVAGLVGALAPALLGALIVTQVFAGDRQLVLDARAAGLLTAVTLVAFRVPVLGVVAGAALVTALARAV